MNLGSQDEMRVQLRRGAAAVAAARVAIGVTALVWPALPSRPWVGVGTGTGDGAAGLAGRVFGRALGGRDLALGLGALAALNQLGAGPGASRGSGEPGHSGAPGQAGAAPAVVWVAAGALSDALDVVASLAAWRDLPRLSRWLVIGSAAGAALTGAAGALALRPDPGRDASAV